MYKVDDPADVRWSLSTHLFASEVLVETSNPGGIKTMSSHFDELSCIDISLVEKERKKEEEKARNLILLVH